MQDSKPCTTPFGTDTKLYLEDSDKFEHPSLFRSLLGALQCLTLNKPDISFSVDKLSYFLYALTQFQWKTYKRLLRYIMAPLILVSSSNEIQLLNLNVIQTLIGLAISMTRDPQQGTACFLVPTSFNGVSGNKRYLPLKQNIGLVHTTSEVAQTRTLFTELVLTLSAPPIIWCDNQSASSLASNPIFPAYTKHIEIGVHYIRDQVAANNVKIQFVPTDHKKTDILTKVLPSPKFEQFRAALNVSSPDLCLHTTQSDL